MTAHPHHLPAMPEIGHPESYYAKRVRDADRAHDLHAHESAKVGQYITLALDPHLEWDDKLRYFHHALNRHCHPPPFPDEEIWMFYQRMADLVRQYAGQELLRIASQEDDFYAARLKMGQDRAQIEEDAENFFLRIMPSTDHCPNYLNETDWEQLKLIRDQWI